MIVLLISTYELGRQPFGLASPAAWLRRAGAEVRCIDLSREPLDPAAIAAAGLVAIHLPMHTATRLAAPVIERVRRDNPAARLAVYGLYAPPNAEYLRALGVHVVLGPEAEADLVALASGTDGAVDPTRVAAAAVHHTGPRRPAGADVVRIAASGNRRAADGGLYGGNPRLQAPVPALPDRARLRWPVPSGGGRCRARRHPRAGGRGRAARHVR